MTPHRLDPPSPLAEPIEAAATAGSTGTHAHVAGPLCRLRERCAATCRRCGSFDFGPSSGDGRRQSHGAPPLARQGHSFRARLRHARSDRGVDAVIRPLQLRAQWSARILDLVTFLVSHKGRFPRGDSPDIAERRRAAWVDRQRSLHRRGVLPAWRAARLEALPGWTWAPTQSYCGYRWSYAGPAPRPPVARASRPATSAVAQARRRGL